MRGFCHLNLHTDRSQFVGMIRPAEIVDWSVRHGVPAVAVTDHDNMCAAVQLYQGCKKANLKPVYGMEVNLCADKTKRERGSKNLVLLAKNPTGFRHLVILATIGSMFFYYRPRIDMSDLRKYGEGLIALTACMNGVAAQGFVANGVDGIYRTWTDLMEVFGTDDLYIEVQPAAKEMQRAFNEAAQQLADKEPDVKLVATGDPHYLNAEDRDFHEHFMRIKVISSRESEWKYPFPGSYHVRTYDEMVEAFADLHGFDVSHLPAFKAALERPMEIVEGIEWFDIKEGVKIPTSFV